MRLARTCQRAYLVVWIRGWHVVSDFTGSLKHVALIVGPIGDLVLGGQDFHLLLRVCGTDQMAIGKKFHRMAGCADLLVDFEASADRGVIERIERAAKRPGQRHEMCFVTRRVNRL